MYVVHSPLTYCVLFHPRGIALWPAVFSTKSGSACTEIRWDSSAVYRVHLTSDYSLFATPDDNFCSTTHRFVLGHCRHITGHCRAVLFVARDGWELAGGRAVGRRQSAHTSMPQFARN